MATVILSYGETSQLLMLYGTCLGILLLIIVIRFTHKKLRQFIRGRKKRALERLRQQELLKDQDLFGMDDLYIGF